MPRRPRLLTMLVLACALFLRVAVPAGWMPSPANGAFAIAPCVSAAPALAHAAEHGGKGSQHDSKGKNHASECSFAPLQAGFAAVADSAPVPAALTPASTVPQQVAARMFARGPPAPPPPSTGPPAIA